MRETSHKQHLLRLRKMTEDERSSSSEYSSKRAVHIITYDNHANLENSLGSVDVFFLRLLHLDLIDLDAIQLVLKT